MRQLSERLNNLFLTSFSLPAAAYKLPNLGRRHYTVQGASYGRNGLIGEFIRRRTGIARDRFQVCYRLQALIKAAKDDLTGAPSPLSFTVVLR